MILPITKEMSNRFANMAIVCAFLVVIIHCRPVFEQGTVAWWMKQMLECGVCTIAVPFFFFASGFFLAGHIGELGWYRRETVKRIGSLVVPYFIRLTLHAACLLLNRGSGAQDLLSGGVRGWLSHYGFSLTGRPGLSPLWYVRGLVVLVAMSPLLHRIAKLKVPGMLVLFIVYGFLCPGPEGEGFVH